MQFEQLESGEQIGLPSPSIDTGIGGSRRISRRGIQGHSNDPNYGPPT